MTTNSPLLLVSNVKSCWLSLLPLTNLTNSSLFQYGKKIDYNILAYADFKNVKLGSSQEFPFSTE